MTKLTKYLIIGSMILMGALSSYLVISQESYKWNVAEVHGKVLSVDPDNNKILLEWTTDPVPRCSTIISQYLETPNGNWIWNNTLWHSGEGHQKFVNVNGDDRQSTFQFLADFKNVGPGDYKLHLHFEYYCGVFGKLFPQTYKIMPVEFTVPGGSN